MNWCVIDLKQYSLFFHVWWKANHFQLYIIMYGNFFFYLTISRTDVYTNAIETKLEKQNSIKRLIEYTYFFPNFMNFSLTSCNRWLFLCFFVSFVRSFVCCFHKTPKKIHFVVYYCIFNKIFIKRLKHLDFMMVASVRAT